MTMATGDVADDVGGLSIGLDIDMHGNVRLEFGTPVAWLAMPPAEAAGLGRLLIRMAAMAEQAKGRKQ